MDQVAESVERKSEGPWELPEGWAWTQLGEIANLRGEKVDPQSAPNLPFVGMDDIEAHGTEIIQTRPFGTMKSAGNRFYKNDVLYGRLRPYLNKTALASEGGACSGELLAITPSNAVSPKYLQLFMHARRFVNTAMSTVSGDRPRIDFATIAAFDFPLAPLAEQRRIVARIDALFAEIAEGEAALEAARKGLDTFRRALLKAAVTGELTKDWRENNPVTETGHDLLARIAKSRASKGQAKGRGKRAADAPPLDTAALPELPEGWAWGTLGEIADSVRNGTSAAPRAEANANEILRISAVRPLWVDERQIRYLDAEQAAAASDATVEIGDLLFTRYNGSANLVGVGAIYRGSKRFYPDKIIRVRLHEVLSRHLGFVELAVNCGAGRKHIAANIKTTAGQQGLSGESLKETPIPIPPPTEAAEILRRLSDALSAAAGTLSLLDAEAADAARLKQSILKAAFEGRLVPQDPADEPASAMLARLRAAPSTATPARRGRKKRA